MPFSREREEVDKVAHGAETWWNVLLEPNTDPATNEKCFPPMQAAVITLRYVPGEEIPLFDRTGDCLLLGRGYGEP